MQVGKKIVVGVMVFVGVAILIAVGLDLWIKYALPRMLREENKSPYEITYKQLDYSLWDGYIKASQVILVPKAAQKSNTIKSGIYATVAQLEVKNFKIWSVLFSDHIRARSITVTQPEIVLYRNNDKSLNTKNVGSAVVAPFQKIIEVSDIYLFNGDAKIIHTQTKKALLHLANINLQIEGIAITETTLKQKIPFSFEHYVLRCDSLYYRANQFYHLTSDKIEASENAMKIAKFKMVPELSRQEFVKAIPKENDLFVISAETINVKALEWGFEKEHLFAHVEAFDINNAKADIYRNKIPADDMSKKYLYNKLLRDLDFDLKVDTLRIRNALLAYEEEKSFNKGSGKIIFSHFNMTAANIQSGFQKQKLQDVRIHVNCRFMDASPMKVDWRFNVLDKSDGFNIKGVLSNVEAKDLNAFSKPYSNLETQGILKEIYFNFTGNDESSHGQFALKYDNFKVVVYQKKEPRKKNKFLSAVGNLFVKNDSQGQVKQTEVDVKRVPEKSFYNFLWKNIAEGLLKILL